MALTGQAKVDYQREYMRRRRGLAERGRRPPNRQIVGQIAGWVRADRSGRHVSDFGQEVIEGLEFDTDEEWREACYRHKALAELREQERLAKEEEATRPRQARCSFCGEPPSATRLVVGDKWTAICEPCHTEIAETFARHPLR